MATEKQEAGPVELLGSVKKAEKMAKMMTNQAATLIFANAMEIGLALDKEYIRTIKQDGPPCGELCVKIECALYQDRTLSVKPRLSWETKEKIVKESDVDMYDPNQPELPLEEPPVEEGPSKPEKPVVPRSALARVKDAEDEKKTPPSNPRFYGKAYTYPTPNDGDQEIGVVKGLGDLYIVAWEKPNGSLKRINSKHLMPNADPEALQRELCSFAADRDLALVT